MPDTEQKPIPDYPETEASAVFFEGQRVTPREFRVMGFLRSLCAPHEVSNHSLELARIYDAITYQGFRRWSSEETNSAVCGHLLVIFALLLNTSAFFYALSHSVPLPRVPMLGCVMACMAMAAGWGVIRSEHFRMPAIVFTLASYGFVLVWAWNVTR